MMMLLEGNRLISRKISKPIRKLDESVKTYEAGGKPDIYIGGSSEIRHLVIPFKDHMNGLRRLWGNYPSAE